MTGLSRMRKEKRREYSASKAAVMSASEPGSDDDRGVGALVTQVRPVRGGGPAGVSALSFHLRPGVVFQRAGDIRQPGQEITGERLLDGLLAHGDDVGQPDSSADNAGRRRIHRVMPSASATAQACCPPAPPNTLSRYSVTS